MEEWIVHYIPSKTHDIHRGLKMLQFKAGEAYLNFIGTLRTKATEKHYLFLIRRYAVFRKTLDLDKIVEEDSQNPRLAVAHIRHFLSEIQTTIKLSPIAIK